jgi:hypothetical protein
VTARCRSTCEGNQAIGPYNSGLKRPGATRVLLKEHVVIVLLVGPSQVGKTSTYKAVQDRFPGCVFEHLDGLASSWAIRHSWIKQESVGLLREFCQPNDDLFLAIGLQAIADLAAREDGKHLVIDIGAGFQQASYSARLPMLFPTVLLIADPKVAFKRRPEKERQNRRTLEDYTACEFSPHRRRLYDACQYKIDTAHLTREQAANELECVLRRVLV